MDRLLAIVGLCVALPAWSQPHCGSDHVDVIKERASGTADSVANLRKSRDSLQVQLSRLLRNAQDQVTQAKPPSAQACPTTCRPTGQPNRIVVSVIPKKFLNDYADAQKCAALLEQTSKRPLRFGPRRAHSQEELTSWLSDLSRGKGRDGEALYDKCSGKCSPRYFIDAAQDGKELVATVEVVCGPARDKTDNTYVIASAYRWSCHGRDRLAYSSRLTARAKKDD